MENFSERHSNKKFVSVGAIVAHPTFSGYLGEGEYVCYPNWVEPHGTIPRQVPHQVSRIISACKEDIQVAFGLTSIL